MVMLKICEFESPVTDIENFVQDGRVIARIIKVEKPIDFSFKPGQFVMVSMHGYEPGENINKQLWRAYSISSAPSDSALELCISIKEPPSFTHFLNERLAAGVKLRIKGPYGGFILRDGAESINFIAAGTGIAPIMCMIRDIRLKGTPLPARLFYGYRNSNQFYYGGELKAIAEESRNFQLLTIASREGNNPGYVQKLIEDFDFSGNKELADTYICGPPRMVDEAKELMLAKGFPKTRIYVERYD